MATHNRYTSKLTGKTVLVVGGTSGLGFGLAEALVESNISQLYISSSRQSSLDKAISRLKASYPESQTIVTGIPCNLADEKTLESNIQTLFSTIDQKLDHIVHTAGDSLSITPISQVTMESMKQSGMVRFYAPYFIAKHSVSHMTPGPASSITFTSGSTSEKPHPSWSIVSSYAAGLHGMMRALALDLRPVRVNLVSPGSVFTELWQTSSGGDQKRKEAALEQIGKQCLTGKIGAVEDVIESYLYLLKDKNVTGTVIRSDGGKFLL